MIPAIIGLFLTLTLIATVLMGLILLQKRKHRRHQTKVNEARDYIFARYFDNVPIKQTVSNKFLFEQLIDIDEQIKLEEPIRKQIIDNTIDTKFINKIEKNLNSSRAYKRKIASFYLGSMRHIKSKTLLLKRLEIEKDESVKFAIIVQLRYFMDAKTVKRIFKSLNQSSNLYQRRVSTIISNQYNAIKVFLRDYEYTNETTIKHCLVRVAQDYFDPFLERFSTKVFIDFLNDIEPDEESLLFKSTLKALYEHYPHQLNRRDLLIHVHKDIRLNARLALVKEPHKENVLKLINLLKRDEAHQSTKKALLECIQDNPDYLTMLIDDYETYSLKQKTALNYVIGNRIDYLLLKLDKTNNETITNVLINMIEANQIETLINFMNRYSNEAINEYLYNIISQTTMDNDIVKNRFRRYLKKEHLEALGWTEFSDPIKEKAKPPKESSKTRWLLTIIFFSITFFPILFLIRNYAALSSLTLIEMISLFVLEGNYYLIYYFLMINSIYILLLVLSLSGAKKQIGLWRTKKASLLYQKRLLPSISVIAPAYNESLSIIESVTALLNLKYPDYEIVVVNDGSKDNTLSTLIDHFNLIMVQPNLTTPLNTKPIRGIYVTKSIPNLTVIDKVNGGKADALNVGINVANNDYVCGIDADSILEGDALLKVMAATLDEKKPYIALGGNIYPSNGYTFDHGRVMHRGLAKETLPKFQSIEYLRAFTSGRIGWSELRSLMIISGAFGLFDRDTLIDVGGYLTSSSKLKKDTVGEDMELVVRMTYDALKNKRPYRVGYVYNANCYTELPSDLSTLLKQRNRWQRGLIDILSYHRNLFLNPKYKQIGLIGYPYYQTFELMGPFFELIGYILLVIGLFMGILSTSTILAIFTASIMYGIVISLASLYMAEKELITLSKKDTFKLVIFAVLENFGYRQMMSLYRVKSTFSALKESNVWGSQKRKGFQTK